MAENIQVASLTAPITVKIPKKEIKQFQDMLEDVANTLEWISVSLSDMTKDISKTFGKTNKHLKITHNQNTKIVKDYRVMNQQARKHERTAKRTAKAMGGIEDAIAQVRVETGLLSFALGNVVKLMAVPSAITAGFTFLAAQVTGMTTEMYLLSKATGFNMNTMRALELEAKSLGFTFEHVNSLAEELNNKFGGEAGGFIELNLQEGLKALNLEAEKMQKLGTEERLEAILNASARLVKESKDNLPLVASALDKIGGQEANRLWGSMSQKMAEGNMQYKDLIENAGKFTDLLDDNASGSRKFSSFFIKAFAAIQTTTMDFFGSVGDSLSTSLPVMEKSFEGLSKKVLTWLGPATIDKVASMFVMAFTEIVILLNKVDEAGLNLPDTLDSIASAMQGAWRLGSDLAIMFGRVLLAVAPLTALLNNDFVRATVGWTVAGLAAVVAASSFYKILGFLPSVVLATASAAGTLAGAIGALKISLLALSGGTLAGVTLLLGKLVAVGAASYYITKLISEFTGLDKVLTSVVDKLDFFGRGKFEAKMDVQDKWFEDHNARMRARNAQLALSTGTSSNSSVDNSRHVTDSKKVDINLTTTPEVAKDIIEDHVKSSNPM